MEESRRAAILEAALDLLAEHGYDGMSLQMVAARVGLHKSTLFHHFASKDALADQVYVGVAERLRKCVEPFLASDPPSVERALQLSDVLVDHFAAEPAAARLLMRSVVAAPVGGRTPAAAELLLRLSDWLDRARSAGAVRPLKVRHAVLDLMALVLFYPAVAHELGARVIDDDPAGSVALRHRKRELRAHLRGALEPR